LKKRLVVSGICFLRLSFFFCALARNDFSSKKFDAKAQRESKVARKNSNYDKSCCGTNISRKALSKTKGVKKSFKIGHYQMLLKTVKYSAILVLTFFLSSAVAAQKPAGSDDGVLEAITSKTDLYPAGADAKKEIAEALEKGVAEDKRVILIFGGNWCYDCHVLDRALHSGEAGKIAKESYLLVHVDIGEGDKNKDLVAKYKIPLDKGVPALAVLKSDGSMVYWSGYGEFEAARAMLKKDLVAFLNYWKQKRGE
jgi:thioredoxin-related protein